MSERGAAGAGVAILPVGYLSTAELQRPLQPLSILHLLNSVAAMLCFRERRHRSLRQELVTIMEKILHSPS